MDLINVRNVRKHLFLPVRYKHMKELTLERNLIDVKFVVKPSVLFILYKIMKELICETKYRNMEYKKVVICCFVFHVRWREIIETYGM